MVNFKPAMNADCRLVAPSLTRRTATGGYPRVVSNDMLGEELHNSNPEKHSRVTSQKRGKMFYIVAILEDSTDSKRINFPAPTFFPTHTGRPMMMAGTATPATNAIPNGAPIRSPNCHNIFFLRLHGFLPQNVQPDGLKKEFLLYRKALAATERL